ncbi:hypothetical protein Vretimale_9362 [Volvox reticuliferus]|uniref:Uncharacterized protein n=1 Tax=Volvox reticuliferus TaxID=1737510 RepID=A0A8J4GCL5_9CHLO|nr:hypothetical protein Vretimale_9362 [Volvox reticuliferus]
MAESVSGASSYAGSVASSRTSVSRRARHDHVNPDGQSEDLFDRRSSLEDGVFAVLFTLRKEDTEARIRIRWSLLQILLGGWQLYTTIIDPAKQPWDMNPHSM